ncbi:MAG: hypothetical protein RIC29_12760 [Rhodospirillaceae bacterium]
MDTQDLATQQEAPRATFVDKLNQIYSAEVIAQIALTHGLSSVANSLQSTLISAGALYLRYSGEQGGGAADLSPKCRTVTRTSEIARRLKSELEDLDFWDRWKIYKRLETTGHPITENLDPHTQKNPLMAGDILIDEIGLILSAITAYESDFFRALSDKTDKNTDIGLTFFVEVVGAFWESVTGERVFERDRGEGFDPGALAFIGHCVEPLIDINQEIIARIAQQTLK